MTSWPYPSGFDANTALIYANFCQQAYFQYYIYSNTPQPYGYPPYKQIISIPPSGYKLLYDIYYNEGGWSADWTYFGYVAQSEANTGELVFAIRGTETMEEWTDDLLLSNTGPATGIKNVQGNIHQGFDAIYQGLTYFPTGTQSNPVSLKEVLGGASSAVVTGHSLGAALAILLTLDLALNYSSNSSTPTSLASVTCYSLAAPLVGDPTFAAFFNSLIGATSGPQIDAHYRIANGLDKVPVLPPNVLYLPKLYVDIPGTYLYMQVNDFCPIDSGILSALGDPHSLTSYATGLNYLINPPPTEGASQTSSTGLRGLAASLRSKRTATRARSAIPNAGE